ncbi:unnamed protein product [Pseudo-nitzschia multistriata]|uniref:Uncharacterized protein n=1 Tax=Pseudo-nitzschia multistriata TaxID=183589 RepID=A0A448Z3V0_9STRA|nr:unnamed protein product [Pseudo-nitzschia multistriata]
MWLRLPLPSNYDVALLLRLGSRVLIVWTKQALLSSHKGLGRRPRGRLVGLVGRLVVSDKNANVHLAVDPLKKGLDCWKAERIVRHGVTPSTATPVQILHHLRDDVGPESVGLAVRLDVFHHQNATGLDTGKPEK